MRRQLKWYKVTQAEVLDERDLPGRWIPVVPTYCTNIIIDGKVRRFGVIRAAKDPQRMLNYWQTAVTELIALAPKAKYLVAEGQIEGHENEWSSANVKAYPVLTYKQTDLSGKDASLPRPPPNSLKHARSRRCRHSQRSIEGRAAAALLRGS